MSRKLRINLILVKNVHLIAEAVYGMNNSDLTVIKEEHLVKKMDVKMDIIVKRTQVIITDMFVILATALFPV